ncbi:MAG: hypothetical protein ACOC1K_08470 [Nanoarchaeota archaeon]
MNNLILLITGYVILLGYLIYVQFRYGIETSISETFYITGEKWWLSLVLVILAFSMLIPGLELGAGPLFFISGASVLFIVAAPAFKDDEMNTDMSDLETKVHFYGSYIAVLFGILSIIFDFSRLFLGLSLLVYIILHFLFGKDNKIFWIEIITITAMFITLFFKSI